MRNAYNIFMGEPEGKEPLGSRRRRWEIGREGVDWIYLAQDRDQWQTLVNTVMDLRVS